jgi:hypothetical protein
VATRAVINLVPKEEDSKSQHVVIQLQVPSCHRAWSPVIEFFCLIFLTLPLQIQSSCIKCWYLFHLHGFSVESNHRSSSIASENTSYFYKVQPTKFQSTEHYHQVPCQILLEYQNTMFASDAHPVLDNISAFIWYCKQWFPLCSSGMGKTLIHLVL